MNEKHTHVSPLKDIDMPLARLLLSRTIIILQYLENRDAVVPIDQSGLALTREEFEQIYESVQRFYDFADDEEIRDFNQEILEKQQAKELGPSITQPRAGWVYLLQGEKGLYKIGMTTRPPSQRLAEFVPRLPFNTVLLHSIPTDDVIGLERRLHQQFKKKRVNGEWFQLSQNDVAWLMGDVK